MQAEAGLAMHRPSVGAVVLYALCRAAKCSATLCGRLDSIWDADESDSDAESSRPA